MNFGCCTSMKNYALLAEMGYDYIELAGVELYEMTGEEVEDAARTLARGRVECVNINTYCPESVAVTGPRYDRETVARYARAVLKRAHRLGATMVGFGAPKSRILPEGYDRAKAMAQFKEAITVTCEIAEREGIEILLEAICAQQCDLVNTTREAVAVVETLALPNLNLVYDTFHAEMMGEDTDAILAAAPYMRHFHVAQPVDGNRCYLDKAHMDNYRRFIAAALSCGYDGAVSVEAMTGDFESGARRSLEILRSVTENLRAV